MNTSNQDCTTSKYARALRFSGMALLFLFGSHSQLHAEDERQKPKASKAVSEHWLKVSRTHAESFELSPATDGVKPYSLYEKPVFRHTQSVRGDDIGAMHVWTTADKRPAVVGAIFAWTNSKTTRMGSYEFHSLTSDLVKLQVKDRVVWTSRTPGFDWTSFPTGTPAPPANKLQQRLQANRLARKFAAKTTAAPKEKWELRLVPTPIYQYASKEAGVTHGAMYAFCQGTDTEVILLIESFDTAEKNAEAELSWRYALVPFTDYKARVSYAEQAIWESAPGRLNENGKPHFWSVFGSIPKPEFEIKPAG
jgi:hypothetical protein